MSRNIRFHCTSRQELGWVSVSCSIAVAACVFGAGQASAGLFLGLGDLTGGNATSAADGLSTSASVVVGGSGAVSGVEAFRWTQVDGMVGLGDLSGGSFYSWAKGVSADGSVVVGRSNSTSGYEAFLWTQAGGMVGLGDLTGGDFDSFAHGVSADGSVVVGLGRSDSGAEAFRWTQAGGMVGLGDLPGGIYNSLARGVSADGSVVVGASTGTYGSEAFRWTQAGGMVGLGDLNGGSFQSDAYGISADGTVVVGAGQNALGTEAFRWTQADGMVGLGDLPGGQHSSKAHGVSADGSVIVGTGYSDSGHEAFLWTQEGGMQGLWELLSYDYGLDLTGWRLSEASGVSLDGLQIVGWGTNPSGSQEAWLADLSSPVPEPSSVILLGFVCAVIGAGRLRRRAAARQSGQLSNHGVGNLSAGSLPLLTAMSCQECGSQRMRALKRFLTGMVMLVALSGEVRAELLTYQIEYIGEFGTTPNLGQVYSGTGYVGMWDNHFVSLLGLDKDDFTRTVLQIDISGLEGSTINSAQLDFTLLNGSSGTQTVTVTSFTADGELAYFWTPPDDLGSNTYSVTGLADNSLDVTDLLQERVSSAADWLGLHLRASTLNHFTQLGDSDTAQVRLVVDHARVPEPSCLVLVGIAASATGISIVRRRRQRSLRTAER